MRGSRKETRRPRGIQSFPAGDRDGSAKGCEAPSPAQSIQPTRTPNRPAGIRIEGAPKTALARPRAFVNRKERKPRGTTTVAEEQDGKTCRCPWIGSPPFPRTITSGWKKTGCRNAWTSGPRSAGRATLDFRDQHPIVRINDSRFSRNVLEPAGLQHAGSTVGTPAAEMREINRSGTNAGQYGTPVVFMIVQAI